MGHFAHSLFSSAQSTPGQARALGRSAACEYTGGREGGLLGWNFQPTWSRCAQHRTPVVPELPLGASLGQRLTCVISFHLHDGRVDGKVGLRERKKSVPVTQPVGDRAKDVPGPPGQKVTPWSSPVPWPVGEASLGGFFLGWLLGGPEGPSLLTCPCA